MPRREEEEGEKREEDGEDRERLLDEGRGGRIRFLGREKGQSTVPASASTPKAVP